MNKALLIGNLGSDPETRQTNGGKAVTKIRLATNQRWTDANGDRKERTEWHSVTFFDRLAEVAAQYLRKGSKLYVEGRLQTSSWTDNDSGQTRYATEIICRNFEMLDRAPEQPQVATETDDPPVDDEDIPF